MSKFIGAIVGAIQIGVGILTSNPALIASGIATFATSTLALLFAPGAPKPDSAETQVKNPIPPRTRGYGTRRGYGSLMLYETAADGAAVDVVAFFDGRSHAMRQAYANDDKITITGGVVQGLPDGRYANSKMKAGFSLGLPTETAFAPVISKLPGIWTAAHRGDGITAGYLIKEAVKAKDFLEIYPQGDTVQLSAAFDLQYCFDFRDPTQSAYDPNSWVKSTPLLDNPVLCLLHYLITARGIDFNTRILPVISYWQTAADYCDSLIQKADGSYERRYRCCVMYDSTAEPGQIINDILLTFDGWYCPDALGRLIIYAGAYNEPTVEIGPDHIVDYRHQANLEDEDVVNQLSVTYVSDLHDYAVVDAQPWRDEDDISARGKEVTAGIAPQSPSFTQNRRLAKISMARHNAKDRGSVTTNFSGRIAIGQRFIRLHLVEAGSTFFYGVAEITTMQKNMQSGGITFEWMSVDPNSWAWNAATEDGLGAPVGNRVAQQPIDTPAITTATPVVASDGSSAQIEIVATGPNRSDLVWFARWKRSTDSVWNEAEYPDIDPGASVTLVTSVVPLNTSIDVAVSYKQGDGRTSDWSTTSTVSTSTAGLAPGPTTNVSATGGVGQVTVNWRNPGSTNYSYTRNYRTPGNTFTSATALTPDDAAGALAVRSATYSGLGAGSYYIWSRSFSASGVGATPTLAGMVVVT